MKKIFLFTIAMTLVGTAAFAQQSQTVCEKFDYPEIIHRPRCFESQHCKNFPKVHCEDLIGDNVRNKSTACCWEGPRPGENGGRGGSGAKSGSGPNGLYKCGDPGAEGMPICTNPAKTDQKCCWPVYTKGGAKSNKGTNKGNIKPVKVTTAKPSAAAKSTPTKAPVKAPVKAETAKTTKTAK